MNLRLVYDDWNAQVQNVFSKMPGKRRDFYVIVLNLNHLKSIGMAVVLEDGPGDAMFGMFSHFRPKITCVNGFW